VASYDPIRNITYGYLRHVALPKSEALQRLLRYIREIAPSTMHPLLLPALIAEIDTSRLLRDHDANFENAITEEVNFANTMSDSIMTPNPLELPLEKIVGKLTKVSASATYAWLETETWANTLPLMRKAIAEVGECVTKSPHVKEISDQLERRIEAVDLQNQSVGPKYRAAKKTIDRVLSAVRKSI
jgi:hypothetical protein